MGRKAKDLKSQRFGKLTVIEQTTERIRNAVAWKCKCDCGGEITSSSSELQRGNVQSCTSCRRAPNFKDLTGQVFGELTVVSYAGLADNYKKARWLCKCSCGRKITIHSGDLSSGNTRTCGNGVHRQLPSGEAALNTLIRVYKRHAEERDYYFNLTKEQFRDITSQNCHYCGIEPSTIQKATGGYYIYNGIDRKDNTVGYTVDNCVPCCKHCNTAKLERSYEEFLSWINKIYNKHN